MPYFCKKTGSEKYGDEEVDFDNDDNLDLEIY